MRWYLLWKGFKRELFVLWFWLWEPNGVYQNRSVIDVTTNFLSILLTNIMLSAGRAASEWQIISINTVEIWAPMKMTGSSVKLLYAQKYRAYNMIFKIGCPIMWAAGGRMLSSIHQFRGKIILTAYPESAKNISFRLLKFWSLKSFNIWTGQLHSEACWCFQGRAFHQMFQ